MPFRASLSNPALRTLVTTVGVAFGIQTCVAGVSIPLQTEKYYDLSGSFTFISCTLVSLYAPHLSARFGASKIPLPGLLSGTFHPRQLLVSGLTAIWAARLGTFLFKRVQQVGSDSRFDDIKKHPGKFFGMWMAQAIWVSLTAMPVYLVNSIPAAAHPALGAKDLIGLALWVGSFGFEVVADTQKGNWKKAKDEKKHDEKFITSGLWSISRHPNYVGEVSLWAAQFVISTSVLASASGMRYLPPWSIGLAAASPIIEYILIAKFSGVPPLEASGDKKFGDDPKWQEYKRRVGEFWPKLF